MGKQATEASNAGVAESITWDDLWELLGESKAMARGLLLREHGASIQSTELVLTALGRLRRPDQDWSEVEWANRKYFFGALYKAMRRALIDHARRRMAIKRAAETRLDPEQFARVLVDHDVRASLDSEPELIEALMQALEALREEEPDWATMVEYRFFGGLTLQETADMMDVSMRTIQRWWIRARLVLHQQVTAHLKE